LRSAPIAPKRAIASVTTEGAIVVSALKALADEERIAPSVVTDAIARFGAIGAERNPWD
jgi:pyruvate dehydrogenase complex dehydrogenase (E1) component